MSQERLNLLWEKINNNKEFRKEIAKSSLIWFAKIYFNKYLFYKTAPFQKEICKILQNKSAFNEIIAFRGSAKTTMAMLFLPIWAVITGDKHFVVLVADTFPQIKDHIANIKSELEDNERLIQDFGPFNVKIENQKKEEWQKTSMVISNYNAKIIGRSTGQKVRGIRYKQWRPDLIVVDDIEDQEMVRTIEQRDKTYRWFTGDVIPSGEKNKTKYILVGNLLHSDAIMSRIRKEIVEGNRDGEVVEFPLINDDGIILWQSKFPGMEAIEVEKRKVGANSPIGMRAWQREYLLKIVPEEGQVIKDEWIRYYDGLPDEDDFISQGTGNDLAISKKTTADYTAMVSGKLFSVNDSPKIYIMPYPVNERLSGFETTERAKVVSALLGNGIFTQFWVEDVAYQAMQIEAMIKAGLPVEGVKVSVDKRARLMTIASYVQNGTVVFPKEGCEDLIIQLLGFGVEAHDDLVDAFVILIQKLMSQYGSDPVLD